jgi:hypothetical protein
VPLGIPAIAETVPGRGGSGVPVMKAELAAATMGTVVGTATIDVVVGTATTPPEAMILTTLLTTLLATTDPLATCPPKPQAPHPPRPFPPKDGTPVGHPGAAVGGYGTPEGQPAGVGPTTIGEAATGRTEATTLGDGTALIISPGAMVKLAQVMRVALA